MVFFIPSSKLIFALNPNSFSALVVSSRRLGCPLGFFLSQMILPLNLVNLAINFTKSLMEISNPVPMFTGSLLLYFSEASRIASAASSTYKNSLVGVPSPQTTIFSSLFWIASKHFFMRAGMTWEDSRSKLSPGP